MTEHPNRAARVFWEMGQKLLPEHFTDQEASLREELKLQLDMLAMPLWGVAALAWDTPKLEQGLFRLVRATIRFDTGLVIDVPRNAQAKPPDRALPASAGALGPSRSAPLQIELALPTGGNKRVKVFLHVFEVHSWQETDSGGAPVGIRYAIHGVVLSPQDALDGSRTRLELAHFVSDVKGVWSLASDFLPPLLRVNDSPFFEPIRARIDALTARLLSHAQQNDRAQSLAAYSKLSAQQCLRAVYEQQAFMADLDESGIGGHPYDVFRAARRLYIAACTFYEQPPSAAARPYDHDDLATSFHALLDAFEKLVERQIQAADHALFVWEDGQWVCALPKEALTAGSVYLLVERSQTGDTLTNPSIKLAAPSRLATMYQRALSGVRYERIQPTFSHHFSERIVFYQLDIQSDEWTPACREGRIAFYPRPELQGRTLSIHWRDTGSVEAPV